MSAHENIDVVPPLSAGRAGVWAVHRRRRKGWTYGHLVSAFLMVALGVFLTRQAWVDMFMIAGKDEEASHIFLVPIIIVWLVYVRRERLRYCVPRNHWIGPAMIAAGWIIASFGYYNSYQALWHGGSVVVVVGCLLTVVGSDILLRFLPAFVVLIFLVPIPVGFRLFIARFLQTILSWMTEQVFLLAGEEIQRFGNLLTINGQDVQVAEACNGMRMVFTLVLVCYAVAFGTPLKGYVRMLIILLSIPTALICNFIRMIPTVWIFGHFAPTVAEGFHDIAGWVMLFVAFLLLMGIIRLLQWAMIPVSPYTLAQD